jgi:predicted permease
MRRILRITAGRGAQAQEIERELRAHIALRAEEFMAAGWPREEAIRRAEAAFGDYDQVAALCTDIRCVRERERNRRSIMDALRQDIRYAVRVLVRAPIFTLTALFTLALGIGACTAIFSIVNALLLRPLPFPAHDRLIYITEGAPAAGAADFGMSLPLAQEIATRSRALAASGVYFGIAPQVRQGDETVRVYGAALQAGVFAALNVAPALGRWPTPAEDGLVTSQVVVLSDGYWRHVYHGDRTVLGRTLMLGGQAHTIIGVMPPEFAFPTSETQLWTSFARLPDRLYDRTVHITKLIGRLHGQVTLESARSELGRIFQQGIAAGTSGDEALHVISAKPLRDVMVADARQPVLALFGAILILLTVACANLAGLQLARGAMRQSEIAVRSALGAGRWAVVRQFTVETLLLCVAGWAGGILLARLLHAALVGLYPGELPFAERVTIDARVLLFAGSVAMVAMLLFGIVPAWLSARTQAFGTLQSGAFRQTLDRSRHRVRASLVVAEIALACVLITAAALVGRSFARVHAQPPGFQTAGLLLMRITPSRDRIPDVAQVTAFYQQLPERLARVPGVQAASAASTLPISGGDSHGMLTIEGKPFPGAAPSASYRRVLPSYFRAVGIPLRGGREFDGHDRGSEPYVTIVNETLARRHFGSASAAVGQRIKVGPPEGEPWLTIVGVVGDVRNEGLESNDEHATYEPHPQRPWRTMQLVVRANDPMSVLPGVRAALRTLDPSIVIEEVTTMRQRVAESLAPRRFNASVLGAFGSAALLLAGIGLYGISAFLVTERRREFGIRAALGATRSQIRALVLKRGLRLAGAGLVFGIPAALAAGSLLQRLLYQIESTDPASLLVSSFTLCAISIVACWFPARRATRVDPARTLREH